MIQFSNNVVFALNRSTQSPCEQLNKAMFVIWSLLYILCLKGPSQPPPFSVPSKLFTLLGEAKSYCISVSCVPEAMFDYHKKFESDFLRFDMLRKTYSSQILVCKQKQRCG